MLIGMRSDSHMIMELRVRPYINEEEVGRAEICTRTYLTIMTIDQIVRHKDMHISV